METQHRLSSRALCREAGITYRQLDHWTGLGLFSGCLDPSPGSGALRSYSEADVALARRVRLLREAGLPLDRIAAAVRLRQLEEYLSEVREALSA